MLLKAIIYDSSTIITITNILITIMAVKAVITHMTVFMTEHETIPATTTVTR